MVLKVCSDWRDPLDEGKERILGAELFRSIVSEKRPAWIGGILEAVLVAARWDFLGFGQRMLTICRDRSAWGTAESLFHELRQASLNFEIEGSPVECAIVDLLEISAKVVFNASGARPGFDAHAGERVLSRVWQIMRFVDRYPGREELLCRVEEALWRGAKKVL